MPLSIQRRPPMWRRLFDKALLVLVFLVITYFIVQGIIIPAMHGLVKLLG